MAANVLSDFVTPSGHEIAAAAVINAVLDGIGNFYIDSSFGGVSALGSIAEGDLQLDSDTYTITAIRRFSSSIFQLNDNPDSDDIRTFFASGTGSDLHVHLQDQTQTSSFQASTITVETSSNGNRWRVSGLPSTFQTIMNGISTGDRFILAFTRPSVASSPTVTITNTETTIVGGATLQITHTATGSPVPQITYQATVGSISATGLYTAPASTQSEQTVTITVTATNSQGSVSDTHTLTIPAVGTPPPTNAPTRPNAPSLEALNDESVRVTWDAPASTSALIDNYDIRHRRNGTSDSWTVAQNVGLFRRYVIGGLIASTAYEVQVLAKNSNGDSSWSSSTVVTTEAPSPATLKSYRSGTGTMKEDAVEGVAGEPDATDTCYVCFENMGIRFSQPPAEGSSITVTYKYASDSVVTMESVNSIEEVQRRESTEGVYETVVDVSSLNVTTSAVLEARGDLFLRKYADYKITMKFFTLEKGWKPGQSFEFQASDRRLDGQRIRVYVQSVRKRIISKVGTPRIETEVYVSNTVLGML